jgi:aminodeoxyfutalosine deaminase
MTTTVYNADWVLPISSSPIKDGVVVVRNGLIISVSEHEQLKDNYDSVVKLDGALLPGFVNAHTHLELSGLKGKVTSTREGLSEWLHRLNDQLETYVTEKHEKEIREEVENLRQVGVVAIGDITNTGITYDILRNKRIGGVVFREYIDGLGEEEMGLPDFVSDKIGSSLYVSLSPHALYSTSKVLLEKILKLNKDNNRKTSIHWLESLEELDLYRNHDGPLSNLLHRLWPCITSRYEHSMMNHKHFQEEYFSDQLILVHALESDNQLLKRYKESGVNIVICPRSNYFISGELPPLRDFVSQDISFAIGTDSLASVEDLDVRKEIVLIRENFPEISAEFLLKSLTYNGAKALGIDDQFGSIEVGKSAKLVHLNFDKVHNNVERYIIDNFSNLSLEVIG